MLCLFTPADRANWTEGWVNSGAGLDDMEKRNFLTIPGQELRPLDHQSRSQMPTALPLPLHFEVWGYISIEVK
jgi:hypothetical protein